MRKLGRKGMMDDWFDFLFTVIACFFILLFIGIYIRGALDAKKQEALNQLEKTILVDDYLVEERVTLNQNKKIDVDTVDKEIENLRRFGKPKEVSSGPNTFSAIERR
jgi:hypothetical protein